MTVWDYYMDWGLFRSDKPKTPFLRNNLTFEPKFYYQCMIINLLFRHFWVVPMIVPHLVKSETQLSYFQPMLFFSMIVEMVRRSLWAVIRVENESINNFEEYRSINTIPPIKEDFINE